MTIYHLKLMLFFSRAGGQHLRPEVTRTGEAGAAQPQLIQFILTSCMQYIKQGLMC